VRDGGDFEEKTGEEEEGIRGCSKRRDAVAVIDG